MSIDKSKIIKLHDDELWAELELRYKAALSDVQETCHDLHVWVNVFQMFRTDDLKSRNGTVPWWLFRATARSLSLCLRRQTDTRQDPASIRFVLKVLLERRDLANVDRYRAMAPRWERSRDSWRTLSPQLGYRIDLELVEADLARLVAIRESVEGWVNKRVAHRDLTFDPATMTVTLAELRNYQRVLSQILLRWYPLFHPQEQLAQITPDPNLGWLSIFEVPWKPGDFVEITAAQLFD